MDRSDKENVVDEEVNELPRLKARPTVSIKICEPIKDDNEHTALKTTELVPSLQIGRPAPEPIKHSNNKSQNSEQLDPQTPLLTPHDLHVEVKELNQSEISHCKSIQDNKSDGGSKPYRRPHQPLKSILQKRHTVAHNANFDRSKVTFGFEKLKKAKRQRKTKYNEFISKVATNALYPNMYIPPDDTVIKRVVQKVDKNVSKENWHNLEPLQENEKVSTKHHSHVAHAFFRYSIFQLLELNIQTSGSEYLNEISTDDSAVFRRVTIHHNQDLQNDVSRPSSPHRFLHTFHANLYHQN
jgi:hypothetical protein